MVGQIFIHTASTDELSEFCLANLRFEKFRKVIRKCKR